MHYQFGAMWKKTLGDIFIENPKDRTGQLEKVPFNVASLWGAPFYLHFLNRTLPLFWSFCYPFLNMLYSVIGKFKCRKILINTVTPTVSQTVAVYLLDEVIPIEKSYVKKIIWYAIFFDIGFFSIVNQIIF